MKLDAEGELDAEETRRQGSSRGGSWTWRKLAQRKLAWRKLKLGSSRREGIGKIKFLDLGVLENREQKNYI